MGAMVPTGTSGTGTYRYDGTASGIQHYDSTKNRWVDQSKTGGTVPLKMWDPTSGRLVDQSSAEGKALQAARKKKADQWAAASQAAEMEAVNAQEVEDRVAENKDRNASINALAMSQAGNGLLNGGAGGGMGGALGRGIFQRKQTGTSANQAVAGLNNANAAALAASRRKLVASQQKANIGYQNPMVGYAGALGDIASRLPKPGDTSLGSLMGLT